MLARRNGDAVRPALCALRRGHLIENVGEVAIVDTGDLIAPLRNRVERIHYRLARLTVQPREVADFGGRHHGERSSWLVVAHGPAYRAVPPRYIRGNTEFALHEHEE